MASDLLARTDSAAKARSKRPCDSCRRRKSRCELEGGRPPCVLCKFHHQHCTYDEEPQTRKRRASSTLVDRDSSNPPAATHDEIYEENATLDSKKAKIRQDLPIDDYANLRGPTLLKRTLGLQRNKHSRYIGATSEYERMLLRKLNADKTDVQVGAQFLRSVDGHGTTFLETLDSSTRNYGDDLRDLDAIETIVAPHGEALIRLYLRIVHPSFPILHKQVWLEKYGRTHREYSPPCLAGVYLMALNWWSYSAELASLPKPDVTKLEELALSSYSNVVNRPKLATIQAGLLLLQRPNGGSWSMCSQLVAIAQEIGLHRDCTYWKIPQWERGLRKRLAWAVFMQDKWGALCYSRPSHITADDWEVQPLSEDDFPENVKDEDDEDGSTEVEKGRVLFCEMIKLTQILDRVLKSFYSRKTEREIENNAREGIHWLLNIVKPIQITLRDWFASLPAPVKIDEVGPRKLSSAGYLHLAYCAVEISLHRPIIRSLTLSADQSLRQICRQAAHDRLTHATNFVAELRPEHLQSFWFFGSEYNFVLIASFIALLWATADDPEEAENYKKAFERYRWSLTLCSKSAEVHERAISMLASSVGVLVKRIPDLSKVSGEAQRL